MTRFGPRHFMAPLAAFSMAIVLGFYVRSSIKRARFDARMEQQRAHEDERIARRESAALSKRDS
jgi:hypothetical protein